MKIYDLGGIVKSAVKKKREPMESTAHPRVRPSVRMSGKRATLVKAVARAEKKSEETLLDELFDAIPEIEELLKARLEAALE